MGHGRNKVAGGLIMYPLRDGMFAPRNHWYVAAWSSEITREPIQRWLLNEPVALYRTQDGTAVALQGRCPHRHFPLGLGRVVGDAIECGYHGMTFGPDGRCVKVQTQSTIPPACNIRSFPLIEKWRWLWIWMGEPTLADPALIPNHDELQLTGSAFVMESDIYYPVPGRYMLMHDNLLDLSHLAFLHKSTIASEGGCDVPETRTEGPRWTESARTVEYTDCPPYFSKFFDYCGKVDRKFALRFYLPCLHAGYDTFLRVKAADGTGGAELGTLRVYHAITPGTLNTAHYFFAFGRNFGREDSEFGKQMADAVRITLEEDMSATREIERMVHTVDHLPKEVLLKSDAHCVHGRRSMEALIKAEEEDQGAKFA
jgi:phenylpropionate dioxygenase-like ring-hydroxylating dioxygenase large terminal subunit